MTLLKLVLAQRGFRRLPQHGLSTVDCLSAATLVCYRDIAGLVPGRRHGAEDYATTAGVGTAWVSTVCRDVASPWLSASARPLQPAVSVVAFLLALWCLKLVSALSMAL